MIGINPTSVLWVPIHYNNDIIAVMQMMHMNREFSSDDEDVIRLVEPIIASILRNQDLINSLKQEKLRDIQLLEGCKLISSELEIDSLATTISYNATIVAQAEDCRLYLIDTKNKELVSINQDTADCRYPINQGIVGFVATTGQQVFLSSHSYHHILIMTLLYSILYR